MNNFSRDRHGDGRDEEYIRMIWRELIGIPEFRPYHVRNPKRLIDRLRKLADERARHLAARLPAFVRERLHAADPAAPFAALLPTILTGFDLLQSGPPLYDALRLAGLRLSEEGEALLRQRPTGGDELARLNRLIMEAILPDDLRKTKGFNASLLELVVNAKVLMRGKVVRGVRDGQGDKEPFDFAMDTIVMIAEGRRVWDPWRKKGSSLLHFAKHCVMRSEVNHWLERFDNSHTEYIDPTRRDDEDDEGDGGESARGDAREAGGPAARDEGPDEGPDGGRT